MKKVRGFFDRSNVNYTPGRSDSEQVAIISLAMKEPAMDVSGVSSSVSTYIPPATAPKTAKPSPSPAVTNPASISSAVAASTTATPAPTTPPPSNAPATVAAPAPTPQVDPVRLAIKEGNEPLYLLTQQAKQGDVVARLILKQMNAKAAAKEALVAKPQAGSLEAAESRKGVHLDRQA